MHVTCVPHEQVMAIDLHFDKIIVLIMHVTCVSHEQVMVIDCAF